LTCHFDYPEPAWQAPANWKSTLHRASHSNLIYQWSEHATMLSIKSRLNLYQRFSERRPSIAESVPFDHSAAALVTACSNVPQRQKKSALDGNNSTLRRVIIVERNFLHYRVAVYQRLRELLHAKGVHLQLLIGVGTPEEMQKRDQSQLDWTITLPTKYFFRNKVCWLPFGSYAKDAELVILMHENKLIYNLWLMFFDRPRRLAFWGHGRNMQSKHPDGLRERFKRWTVNKVDWWFAYTEGSAVLVNNAGFPRARTTVVENAIDTREMTALCREISSADRERLRLKFGTGSGKVGLYVGSLYEEKRVDFLLDAARRIRQQVPDFHLLVVGAGADQAMVEAAAHENSWIHYLGPLQGRQKAETLVVADVMLNPGLVGLGILDSFINGTPMFTTDCGLHSPEIEYLSSGTNGVMTANNLAAYTNAVVEVLANPAVFAKLRKGALSSASRYTVENMAERICNGIMSCMAID
jgi:glycosyltransferase involved in cell wall biosynthesis